MIPVEMMSVARGETLEFGDAALVLEFNGGLTIIGQLQNKPMALFFDNDSVSSAAANELFGTTLKLPRVRFEADPTSAINARFAERSNGLLLYHADGLSVYAKPASWPNDVVVSVAKIDGPQDGAQNVAFSRWRIVLDHADKVVTVLSFRDGKIQAFPPEPTLT